MRNKYRFAQKAFSVLLSLALILPGCGGGGGGGSSLPRQPALMPAQSRNAPITGTRDGIRVGNNVNPGELTPSGVHGNASISSGRVRDGESAERVKDFLEKQAVGSLSDEPGVRYISVFNRKPVVVIRETTSDRYVHDIIRTVQLINTALPYDKRITVSPERGFHPPDNYHEYYIPTGHIYVGIMPQGQWPSAERPPVTVGGAELTIAGSTFDGPAAHIWVNSAVVSPAGLVRKVLAHEILHALGFLEHIEPGDYRSLTNTGNRNFHLNGDIPQIDTDALYALYTRYFNEIGYSAYDPNDLGPWTDVSFHLRGDMEDVSFGASSRNGLLQPWAFGPSPAMNLSDNQALSGSVSWTGRLLGFTSNSESLAGAADLTINLATLRGRIDFTNLEYWGVHAAPGAVGSGQMWNDGDLRYGVVVRGNSFVQTGGDAGEVTGMFYGAEHQAMGGVVERSDMAAGFGGTR